VTMAMIANVVTVFVYTTTTLSYQIYKLLNNVKSQKS
jgi:hypothetical protein